MFAFKNKKFNIISNFYFLIYLNKMLEKAKSWIEKVLKHLEIEFSKLQLGRANPSLVEDVKVEQYWSMQSLKNISNINVMDSQTLSIKPWDNTILNTIVKAISNSGMWLNLKTMANSILIKIPPLTEERRKEIVKIVKSLTEEAKIWIRNARSESHKLIVKAKDKKEISEDEVINLNNDLQEIVNDWNKKVDDLSKKKEEDIMKL